MVSDGGWNRRAMFSRRGLEAAARLSAASDFEPGARRAELTVARRAMACEFSVVFPAGVRHGVDAGCAALDEVERLERRLSVFMEDSDLCRVNREAAESEVTADDEVYRILRLSAGISAATGGAFDAAGGALVRAWGFLDGPKRVPSEAELSAALAVSGSGRVRFNDAARTVRFACSGVEFNLGGIGKGFAIDRALGLLRARFHIRCALMQGGRSSIRGVGVPPGEARGWKVDLGHPLQAGRHLARVFLRNRALGTTTAENRFFVCGGRRYGHVLDPRSGRPAEGLLSASAVAPTAAEADALSTAFFVMDVGQTRRFCREHPGVGALLVAPGTSQDAAPQVILTGAIDAEVFA